MFDAKLFAKNKIIILLNGIKWYCDNIPCLAQFCLPKKCNFFLSGFYFFISAKAFDPWPHALNDVLNERLHLTSPRFFSSSFHFVFHLSVRVRIPKPTATWASQNLERISTFFNVRPLKWLLAVVSYLQRSIFRRHKKRRKKLT